MWAKDVATVGFLYISVFFLTPESDMGPKVCFLCDVVKS